MQPTVTTPRPAEIPENYWLGSYTFTLPEEQIAQHPSQARGGSRLCVVDRKTGENTLSEFRNLRDFLPKDALLVVNNSKVLPARLLGQRPTGGKAEFLMLTPLPLLVPIAGNGGWQHAEVEGLVRMSKRVKADVRIDFCESLYLVVTHVGEFGRCKVALHWQGDIKTHFVTQGHLPLPPYIKREDGAADADRYQTVYAKDEQLGSVAAPTAGLHFTEDLRAELTAYGFEWAEVTLYVGYGTFSPVRCKDIRDHAMHEEFIEISEEAAEKIQRAKEQGRAVITVGTTSTRVLEGAYAQTGKICPFRGHTNIFIYPEFTFRVSDCMITNFHLPESSLLMMVSAYAGRQRILGAYEEAISAGFKVFSYGDSMLIR